jgi:hypothetical protein
VLTTANNQDLSADTQNFKTITLKHLQYSLWQTKQTKQTKLIIIIIIIIQHFGSQAIC